MGAQIDAKPIQMIVAVITPVIPIFKLFARKIERGIFISAAKIEK